MSVNEVFELGKKQHKSSQQFPLLVGWVEEKVMAVVATNKSRTRERVLFPNHLQSKLLVATVENSCGKFHSGGIDKWWKKLANDKKKEKNSKGGDSNKLSIILTHFLALEDAKKYTKFNNNLDLEGEQLYVLGKELG